MQTPKSAQTAQTLHRLCGVHTDSSQSGVHTDMWGTVNYWNTQRNDELLNSYNATFILGWRANIDFRPVINREAVIAYVAKYASKGETSSSSYQDTLQKAINHLQDSDATGVAYQKMLSSFTSP